MNSNLVKISEIIRDHLTQQKAPSTIMNKNVPKCMYRGEGGQMCAVGCLISDDRYEPWMEGKGVTSLPDTLKACLEDKDLYDGGNWLEYEKVLSRWQQYHDGTYPHKDYRSWVETDAPAHSPQAMHEYLLSAY